MNSLSSKDARKQLPPSLHGLLDLIIQDHIKQGRLHGMMAMPDKVNIDGFVIVDSASARELLQQEITAVGSVLTRPNAPFPYPVDYLTPELLGAILEARQKQEKQKQERQSRVKTEKPKGTARKVKPPAEAMAETNTALPNGQTDHLPQGQGSTHGQSTA